MPTAQYRDLVEACWLGEITDIDTPIDDCPTFHDDLPTQTWQVDDDLLLFQTEQAGREVARAHATWLDLLAEADRRDASVHAFGMPTSSWLAAGTAFSTRAAKAEVRLAHQLAGLPAVAEALRSGVVSVEQATVICGGLARIDHLDATQRRDVAAHLVELASEFGPVPLRTLVNHAVEVVAPEVADAHDRTTLERAEAQAHRDRYLSWRRDHDGSLLLSGKLPAVEGDLLIGHLGALADAQRAGDAVHGLDTSRGQALADALALVVGHHADCEGGPVRGGDTIRVLVTIGYDQLRTGLGQATLLDSDEHITAGQARLLACHAGILPAVLGGGSLPLDLGREQRLFTPAQRTALTLRDRGCAFPGCDRPPADCPTHHVDPWHTGGATDVGNGVLLCPHHHQVVEPDPRKPPDQNWRIDHDVHGNPTFTSPANRTGQRITRQHAKYRT